jgi:hypothetical protein
MNKTENRAAARAYAAEKERRFREDQERIARDADLEALHIIRDYLIHRAKTRGDTRDRLIAAIDDYAGEITGDRAALHSKTASIG